MNERASISEWTATSSPPSGAAGFFLLSRPPAAELRAEITEIIGYQETRAGHYRQREAASLVVPLIVSFGDPFLIGLGWPAGENDRHGTFAAGLFAGPVFIESFGRCSCVQVNFTPQGAYRFFGLPMSTLANAMVPLDALLGPEALRLREHLGAESDWHRRLDMVEAFVARRLCAAPPASPAIAWAYRALSGSSGAIRISDVARRLEWSRKHLAERFRVEIGLTPKTVERIARFNRTTALAGNGEEGWADIAAACGYADQSHLVREFRELAGETPAAWRTRLG